MNIGKNPTVDEGQDPNALKIEVHIFDKMFKDLDQSRKNLYDQQIAFQFISFIRNEEKFKSVQVLKDQIMKDIRRCESNEI